MKRILVKKVQPLKTDLPKPDQSKVVDVARALTDTGMKRPR